MDNKILENNLKALISKKLRRLRENSGETLEKTADFLDLNYSQYYRLLQGTQLPHLATLIKINQAYGLDMNWWFKDLAEFSSTGVKVDVAQKAAEKDLLNNFYKLDGQARKNLQKLLKSMLKKHKGYSPVNNIYFFPQPVAA